MNILKIVDFYRDLSIPLGRVPIRFGLVIDGFLSDIWLSVGQKKTLTDRETATNEIIKTSIVICLRYEEKTLIY